MELKLAACKLDSVYAAGFNINTIKIQKLMVISRFIRAIRKVQVIARYKERGRGALVQTNTEGQSLSNCGIGKVLRLLVDFLCL